MAIICPVEPAYRSQPKVEACSRKPWPPPRGEDPIPVFEGLFLKEFPGGHTNHPDAGFLSQEFLVDMQAKMDLAAGGYQQQVGLAVGWSARI